VKGESPHGNRGIRGVGLRCSAHPAAASRRAPGSAELRDAGALYHRSPLLVFDEATSALDTESERAVQDNIDAYLVSQQIA
jgi:hypothetical protein